MGLLFNSGNYVERNRNSSVWAVMFCHAIYRRQAEGLRKRGAELRRL